MGRQSDLSAARPGQILNEPEQERVLEDLCLWLNAQVSAITAR